MPNHIVLYADSTNKVYQCGYFLLKYLALWNLQPPADTGIIIYTHQPAFFDNFTPFFSDFQLQNCSSIKERNKQHTLLSLVQELCSIVSGKVIYCGPHIYPNRPLSTLFSRISTNSINIWRHASGKFGKDIHPESPLEISIDHLELVTVSCPLILNKDTADQLTGNYPIIESAKSGSATDYFFNYEELTEFSELLAYFFTKNQEESIPNLVKLINNVDAKAILKEKKEFRNLPFYKKLIKAFSGTNWSIKKYKKNLL